MKWKVTLQFLVALIIVSIAINFVNTAVISYFFYKTSRDGNSENPQKVLMIKTSNLFDISSFNAKINIIDGKPELLPAAVDDLKKVKGFVQFVDNNGKVLESINKPENINVPLEQKDANNLDSKVQEVGRYEVFYKSLQGSEGKQIRYVVGLPKPQMTAYAILFSFVSYFLIWNEPKVVSIVLTIFTTVLLGYIFGRRISKPVVRVIDGISELEKGNYHQEHPVKGLYKDVFISLNNLAEALKSNDIERKKIEKMREEWIMNITHDLKTPLSSIKGYAELLTEPDYKLDSPEGKNFAEVILNKSDYMDKLLEDLKLTQKLKNDLLPIKKENGDLVEVLRDVVINILNDPKYENRKIDFEAVEEKINYDFDPVLIQRAFCNIILNSVVHNPEDSQVKVRIQKRDAIVIEVEDNGRGIPREDLQNLFERYYRGTNTEETHNGSGLGLAIAKQIIEAHKGKIELESEIDEGTKVMIKL